MFALFLSACGSIGATPVTTPTPPPLAEELIVYGWADELPQPVIDDFTAEYGVKVLYVTYESMEEALANLQAGEVYDVVNLDNRFIPTELAAGRLAPIARAQVPNFKNISANFRDLVYDPGNKYSIPYSWGTTGLIVHTDLITTPLTHWADLWNPQITGNIALYRGQPREVIALALRSLGYSANTENPAELEAALAKLIELKPRVIFPEERGLISPAKLLISGEVAVAMGYAYDVLESRAAIPAIQYVLPADGALLWGENFVIPANSPQRQTAEVFLNFLLRPDINAKIVNYNLYATPNEAALPFIDEGIRNDPVIFPANDDLRNAEIVLPLKPEVQKLYDDVWARFLAAGE